MKTQTLLISILAPGDLALPSPTGWHLTKLGERVRDASAVVLDDWSHASAAQLQLLADFLARVAPEMPVTLGTP